MTNTISFWDKVAPAYACARHRQVYCAYMAAALARFVSSADARVLEFGCGEALSAERLAERCGSLVLCDGTPRVRAALKARYRGHPKIEVIAPDDMATLPEGTFSLIAANSVIQCFSGAELMGFLALWRRLLRKGGNLVLSDIIPPGASPSADRAALLGLGFREGFFLSAAMGLGGSVTSPDGRSASSPGLTFYTEDELLALLEAARLPATRLRPNVGINPYRMAFQAFRLR